MSTEPATIRFGDLVRDQGRQIGFCRGETNGDKTAFTGGRYEKPRLHRGQYAVIVSFATGWACQTDGAQQHRHRVDTSDGVVELGLTGQVELARDREEEVRRHQGFDVRVYRGRI